MVQRSLSSGIASHRFCFSRVLLTFGLLLLAGQSVQAITLAEYHKKLQEAVSALDTLAQADETESESDYQTRHNQTIDFVRGRLPKKESVDWNGSSLEVNYTWLHYELDTLSSTPDGKRAATLRRITERLQAIEQRVAEVESAQRVSDNKAEHSRKLAEILARAEYARKVKTESALTRMVKRLLEWIKDLFPKPKQLTPGTAGIFSKIAQVFVIALALFVIAYAAKIFLPRVFSSRKAKKKAKPTARIVLGEKLEPDQSAVDLLADAERLARQGELRAAIRKAYIALLVELGDRKLISLAQHKTNRDYLRSVRDLEPLYGNVRTLTESFEQHWYGLTNATETDWRAFRAAYEQTLSR